MSDYFYSLGTILQTEALNQLISDIHSEGQHILLINTWINIENNL